MSLLPLFVKDHWYSMRPTRIVDQHFGMGLDLDDLFSPLSHPADLRSVIGGHGGYYRPWRSTTGGNDTGSTITAGKDKFEINLDVQQFAPEEITVKAIGNNTITVEGKHEEKEDEHGFISRHFVRRYVVPEGHDINNVVSNLSSDGVLCIAAPRIAPAGDEEHRNIPIQQTGVPVKAVKENKKQEGDN